MWKIGFAVAWLVGSWLFGPKQKKNDIFDPGAEEMPRWNTALRGITIPILFGTNRVSSQVTWEHDYTVVRNEGDSGGGKMGGSGGKGGATQEGISYDYYWDFIFHIGMTHQTLNLTKVWLGPERIAGEGVSAIIGGTGGTIIAGEDDGDTEEDERTKLKFEDSIFYSGSGPALGAVDANTDYNAWSEITSDMGFGVRWPHTTYVGFKQLHMGQFPGVPQFSFEVGIPGGTHEPATGLLLNLNTNQNYWLGQNSIFKGDDGGYYTAYNVVGQGTINIYSLNLTAKTSALVASKTCANVYTDASNYGLSLTSMESATFTAISVGVLGSTNYIFVMAQHKSTTDAGGATATNFWGLLYKVNSAGSLVVAGGVRLGDMGWTINNASVHFIGLTGNQTNTDPIMTGFNYGQAAYAECAVQLFPSITALLGNTLNYFDGVYPNVITNYNHKSLNSIFSSIYFPLGASSYSGQSTFFWSLPVAGLLGAYSTRYFWYVGKGTTQAHIDNAPGNQIAYIDTKAATYPNGFVAYVSFGTLSFSTIANAFPGSLTEVVANADFLNATFPFEKTLLYANGVTLDTKGYSDYDPQPITHKIANGASAGTIITIFSQSIVDTVGADMLGTSESLTRFLVFIWDPLLAKYTKHMNGEITPFSRTTDFSAGITYQFNNKNSKIGFVEDGSKIYGCACIDSDTGATNLDRHYIADGGSLDLGAGGDLTPPEIIYQILTSSIFGIGITTSQIDQTSYDAAVAYCVAQEFKISYQCRREESVLSIIDDILSCYGGFLVITNGIIYFKQLEHLNGAATSVRTIDNDHLIADERGKPPVQIAKGARQDTFNKIKVNYFDRGLEYAQNQVEEGDEVDQDLNGIRVREFPALFVMKEKMARTMAVRALWANLYSRDTYVFKIGWKDHDLAPGDCITLVDSYHPALQGGVTARIIEWKEQKRGEFEITAKQEFEYILASSAFPLNITSESVTNRFGGIPIIRDFAMYELPSEYQMGNAGMAYVSWSTHKFARGANLWMSTDGTTYAKVQNREPYQISGVLISGLPAAYDGDFNENIEMILSPRTGWTSNSPDYYFNQTLPNADQAGRAVGASLLWCGSEMMAYQGVTLIAQNKYRFTKLFRGWGGTNIHAHNSGDTLYKHGGGVFYQEMNDDKIGTKVSYKVQPYNLSGHYQDISSITAKSYTIVGRHYTPQISPSLRFNFPDSQRGKTTHFVNSTIDIPIEWEQSALKSGYGSKGYGALGYGNFSPDSQAFRVQVYGSGGAVVRSTSVSSPSFTYTSSMNASDNGAWRGNVAFTVTPYNQYGDALKTSVISLELW